MDLEFQVEAKQCSFKLRLTSALRLWRGVEGIPDKYSHDSFNKFSIIRFWLYQILDFLTLVPAYLFVRPLSVSFPRLLSSSEEF